MEHIERTVETFQAKLREQEAEVAKTKMLINSLLEAMEKPPAYIIESAGPSASLGSLRKDQFYGRSVSTVLEDILAMRQVSNAGPATVNELYETMVAGGYKFDTSDQENAKRGLRISLTKNRDTFHRLPGGEWGLLKWYPNVKANKPSKNIEEGQANEDQETGGSDKDSGPTGKSTTNQNS